MYHLTDKQATEGLIAQGKLNEAAVQGSVYAKLVQKYPHLQTEEDYWTTMDYGDVKLMSEILTTNTIQVNRLFLCCKCMCLTILMSASFIVDDDWTDHDNRCEGTIALGKALRTNTTLKVLFLSGKVNSIHFWL